MSQYAKLQQLLKDEKSGIDLSFYPSYLLNLRTILAEWVEKQDWLGVLSLEGESRRQQCQTLLGEALTQLQTKLKNDQTGPALDFSFHIRNTELQLKKEYEEQPTRFVEDLHHCLEEENKLLSTTMMAQEQAMHVDMPTHRYISAEELQQLITHCRKKDQIIGQIIHAACLILDKWEEEVVNKSMVPRDVFGTKLETPQPPYAVFQKLKSELEGKTRSVIQDLNQVLSGLVWHITRWKTCQLHRCVSRKTSLIQEEDTSYVEQMCEEVCMCMTNLMKFANGEGLRRVDSLREQTPQPSFIPTPAIHSWFAMALKDILRQVVEMFLVVKKQPPLTMMIEKDKGQKDKDDTNSSKKFTTTVGILGGSGLCDSILIKEVEIYLAYNRDLPEALRQNRKPETTFRILHDRQDMRRRQSARNLDSPQLTYERTYEKLRVEHFSRKETKHVYKQLYHVVYDVTFCLPQLMEEFRTQTISFPIIVRTGANQASEHIGAQLWHSFTSPNVYDLKAEVAPSMKVRDAIKMINERIMFIGGPELRSYEKEFLQERLLMAASGKGEKGAADPTITLDNFIKDKVAIPRHGTTIKDTLDFSLWRWLHSIINLLEDETLTLPWKDGIIYGFASRQQCISALRGQVDGTFLLRFSESFLPGNHILAKGGLAAVVQKEGLADFVLPITAEEIEKDGLATMIKHIGCLHLLGTDMNIDDLMFKYPASLPEQTAVSSRYLQWHKKEFIVPSGSDMGASPAHSPHPNGTVPSERKIKKPSKRNQKARTKDTPSRKQHRPDSPESTTSSVPSPLAVSDSRQFQPVGFTYKDPQSMAQTAPPMTMGDNIPTTVLSQISPEHRADPHANPRLVKVENCNSNDGGQGEMMVLEFTPISTAMMPITSVSMPTYSLPEVNANYNPTSYMTGLTDPNLQGLSVQMTSEDADSQIVDLILSSDSLTL